MDLRTEIENYITADELSKAIEHLGTEANTFNQKDDLLIIEKDLNKLFHNERIGAITDETARVERTRINKALLALTDYIINGEPVKKKAFKPSEFIERIPNQRLIGVLLFMEIAIGILGELMPDTIKNAIEDAVGKENYPTVYIIVLVVTIALFIWLSIRKKQPTGTTQNKGQFAGERANIHASLLERYTNRLKQKIDYRLPIDLKLTYTKEGASPNYGHFAKGLREGKKLEEDLVSTLIKYQHLLIIGNPGAGKTTQTLELAKAWLEDEKNTQLPIIFNLAAWRGDYQHFHEWLESALVSGYGFSAALAKEAIGNNEILPLLDGLDEIGKDLIGKGEQTKLRSLCLDAIDRYIALSNVSHLVICSRINEYKDAIDAPIKAEVLVNPLTLSAIKKTLQTALATKAEVNDENAAKNILKLLKNHSTLEEVICTPFFYNIALDIFDERTKQHNLPNEKEALENYLIEGFLHKKLTNTFNSQNYTESSVTHYLVWIANTLKKENLVGFELVTFQRRHLVKKWLMNLFFSLIFGLFCCLVNYLVEGMLGGFVGGLFFSMFFSMFFGFFGSLLGSFVFGCVSGLIFSFVFGFEIFPSDIRKINWNKLLKLSTWINALVFGIIGSCIGGFVFGLVYGFVGSFIFALIFGLADNLVEEHTFTTIERPYQRFNNEIIYQISLVAAGVASSLTIVKYVSSDFQISNDFYLFLFLTLLLGATAGALITAIFNHSILRIALLWEKNMPARWVTFFKYTTKARILEQDGGQWRFRHQILQDYFAEKYEQIEK